MLGDDKFEIRPMGRGFRKKLAARKTDPQDIKLAEECWQTGRDAIYSEKIRSGHPRRDQLRHQLQDARSGK